jgi:dipeptidyl aminopeptidase/acylaminoacyl peptidase
MKWTILGLILLFVSTAPLAGRLEGAVAADGPGVEDFLRMKSFPLSVAISISPDGKRVAYTIQDGVRVGQVTDPGAFDERPGSGRITRGCEVWIASTQGGAPIRVSDPASSSWAPVWSPHGEMLAFFSDSGGRARPWLWRENSKQANAVADVRPQIVDGGDAPKWAADGKSIFFRAASERTAAIAKLRSTSRDPLDSPPPLILHSPEDDRHLIDTPASQSVTALGMANTFAGDLVQVQVETGAATTLTKNRQIYGYWPSPDGTRLAFTVGLGYKERDSDWTLFDVIVRDLPSSHEVVAAHEAELDNSGSAVSWSPDGSQLAYGTLTVGKGTRYWIWAGERESTRAIGDAPTLAYPEFPLWNTQGDKLYAFSNEAVYVFSMKGHTPPLTIHPSAGFGIVTLVGSQRSRTVWSDSTDGDIIYVAERNLDNLASEIHRVRVSGVAQETVAKLDGSLALLSRDVVDATPDGNTLVFPMESPTAPQDLWVANRGLSQVRQLTHINPGLERYKFPERRVVRWVDGDGHDLCGTLVLPSGYVEGHAYPLIVYVYGGESESRWGKQFAATSSRGVENMQLFATSGYAVLVADTKMGTESPMLDLLKSLMPGVDKVVNMGIADENAIGIMGHSYGGYSVYGLLVQTNRFKAGVALSASGNLLSDYGEMDDTGFPTGIAWAENSQGRMGDTPWHVRDKYIENSPFFYLDRVQTPILIAHGDSDWHPAYEDREMFVGLRRLGKTAEYAEYRGAGHRLAAWRYADQVDLAHRMLAWFDLYLRPHAQPSATSDRRNTTGK